MNEVYAHVLLFSCPHCHAAIAPPFRSQRRIPRLPIHANLILTVSAVGTAKL